MYNRMSLCIGLNVLFDSDHFKYRYIDINTARWYYAVTEYVSTSKLYIPPTACVFGLWNHDYNNVRYIKSGLLWRPLAFRQGYHWWCYCENCISLWLYNATIDEMRKLLRPSDFIWRQNEGQQCFWRIWSSSLTAPSHYLKQCCRIYMMRNCFRGKLLGNVNKYSQLLYQVLGCIVYRRKF